MAAADMSWGKLRGGTSDEAERPRARVFRNSGPVVVPPGKVLEIPILVFGIGAPIADVSVSLHVRHRAIGTLTLGLVSPDARATIKVHGGGPPLTLRATGGRIDVRKNGGNAGK